MLTCSCLARAKCQSTFLAPCTGKPRCFLSCALQTPLPHQQGTLRSLLWEAAMSYLASHPSAFKLLVQLASCLQTVVPLHVCSAGGHLRYALVALLPACVHPQTLEFYCLLHHGGL